MEFSTIFKWTNPFLFKGLLLFFVFLLFFFFFFFFFYKECQQKVETLIRRGVMRRLICVCTVCLCPIKRTIVLYCIDKEGLTEQELSKMDLWSTCTYICIGVLRLIFAKGKSRFYNEATQNIIQTRPENIR